MIIEVKHKSQYSYNKTVFLEPHILRLRPREDNIQKLQQFNLNISPLPAGTTTTISPESNIENVIWFNSLIDKLTIESQSVTEINNPDPFAYVFHPTSFSKVPFEYNENLKKNLLIYLTPLTSSSDCEQYVSDTANEYNQQTIPFLSGLTFKIFRNFERENRPYGKPFLPDETFKSGKGSCRDLTYMFMSMLRTIGIATRFVSGYYFDEFNSGENYLHSWAECFIPGGGWRGFDPSTGFAVYDKHVALTSSGFPENTLPVSGAFYGNAVSELITTVEINQREMM